MFPCLVGEFEEDPTDVETIDADKARAARPARSFQLVVFEPEGVRSHPVSKRRLSVGRSSKANITIDNPGVSRQHAEIWLDDRDAFYIKDLGSRNGLVQGGARLDPSVAHALNPGAQVELGGVAIAVERVLKPSALSEAAMTARIQERSEKTYALLRVHAEGPKAEVIGLLSTFVGRGDALASLADADYELLLVDASASQAAQACAGIRFALERSRGEGHAGQVGAATFPEDGSTASALRAVADARRAFGSEVVTDRSVVIEDQDMRSLYALVARVARSELSVLILGETGAGKEVVARTVHARSGRCAHPFLALNCAAFTETMLEAELFGYEKGAFTGATAAKAGLLETAEGGTVFLDELGDMPKSTQTKLLRVVETREIRRVGGLKNRTINVRFISATNRDLRAEVSKGRFREDLYYRLNGFSLLIPPLRERPSDIQKLAKIFAQRALATAGLGEQGAILSDDAMASLLQHPWPGNVRELRNVIERAVVLAGGVIRAAHLGLSKETPNPTASVESLGAQLEQVERARIIEALKASGGNQTQAAKTLGLSRKALIKRLDRYGIERPRKGKK